MTVVRQLLVLSLASMLAACGADPSPSPADAATDTAQNDASDGASDAGADASDAQPDVLPADVTTDTGSDAAEVAVDVSSDAGADVTDAATDTAQSDAPADAARDVVTTDASDAGADVSDATDAGCVEGAVRCDSALVAQTCRGGAWVSTTCNGYSAATGRLESCYMGACMSCLAGDGGVACSFDPPLCMSDEECYRSGRGRCVEGRCARRGPVECASDTDCSVWAPFSSDGCSAATIAGRSTMVCNAGAATRCTIDANCPAAFRCDTATGFCARR